MSTLTASAVGASTSVDDRRGRTLQAVALITAGTAFAAYPLLRGYGPETGLAGARTFAADLWLVAHVLGMLGFVLTAWALNGVDRFAGVAATVGTALLLPYYGAEAYGLHALGERALDLADPAVVAAADLFRYQPFAVSSFTVGLLAVAAAGVRMVLLARRPGSRAARTGLVLAGVALATYLPQFFVPGAGRIAHGLVLGIGLVVLAADRRR